MTEIQKADQETRQETPQETPLDQGQRNESPPWIIDPRLGDIEDDASSTKSRSMLSLAGSLFAEISPAKLLVSWLMLFVLPGLLLGLSPLIVSAWVNLVTNKIVSPLVGIWPLALLLLLGFVGAMGVRSLWRVVESSFWSLNSLAVEPLYAACREIARHLAGRLFGPQSGRAINSAICLGAGLVVSLIAAGIFALAWPASRWIGQIADLATPQHLISIALANTVVLVAGYLGVAAFAWACADAIMPPPKDLEIDSNQQDIVRKWRVAHLSDLHVVGDRYGFRIESGRSGPRGNDRLDRLLAHLDVIDAHMPLDVILITGDLTDSGRSAEWAETMDALARHPRLLGRMLILPGNHDLNIVDRSNPARLDLPTSPNRRLRRLRFLAAASFIHGDRVHVADTSAKSLGPSLDEALRPHRSAMTRFADAARPLITTQLDALWDTIFPMFLPPATRNGLGVILLNSNADAHFSFTNALGMMTSTQMGAIEFVAAAYPDACWIVALHHHVVEYPKPAKVLSERIGTALINGSWFVRRLRKLATRVVVMHGHRHTDWLGECAGVPIISAPSPVMEAADADTTSFYIHTIATGSDKKLRLLAPERIVVEGERAELPDDALSHDMRPSGTGSQDPDRTFPVFPQV